MRLLMSLIEIGSIILILWVLGVPDDKIIIVSFLSAIILGTLQWEIEMVMNKKLKEREK